MFVELNESKSIYYKLIREEEHIIESIIGWPIWHCDYWLKK